MTGCWQSVKELALVIGTLARVVPLPPTSPPSMSAPQGPGPNPHRGYVSTWLPPAAIQ